MDKAYLRGVGETKYLTETEEMTKISNVSRIIQSLRVSIDATNPEEQQIITDLYRAIEIFTAIVYLEEKRD